MVRFHRVFRDAMASGPAFVGTVADGDSARADVVGMYYANVFRLLHGHHEAEDELMTPRLLDRATPDEAAEVRRVAAQHEDVLADLTAAEDRLAAFRADPAPETKAALLDAVAALDVTTRRHLDEEEAVVLPIAARYMNVAEWGEIPAHGMQHFDGDKPWLIIGLIQEQMPPEVVAMMDANMPPPVAEFWASTGRRMFVDYVALLRG
jgi:hypothetical protein